MFNSLTHLMWKDFSKTNATDFEDIICDLLEWNVERQVYVKDRWDWYRGRIYIVVNNWEKIWIEIDRKTPRVKSIYKLKQYNCDRRFIFIRSPFTVIETI
jgi:hypothetical protein